MRSTIRSKFVLFGFFITLLTSIFLSCLIYYNAHRLVKTSFDRISFFGIDSVEFSLDNFMNEFEYTINLLASSGVLKLNPTADEKAEMLKYMNNVQLSRPKILSIYFAAINQQKFVVPSRTLPENYDPRLTSWYIKAINKGSIVWTDIYIDASTGNKIVTLSKPIYEKGQIIGVAAIDVELNTIANLLSNMRLGKSGYFILVDSNNKLMVHPDKSKLNKIVEVESLRKALETKESDTLYYTYENALKRGSFKTLSKTGWKIIGTMTIAESLEYSSDILKNTMILQVVIVIISLILSLRITKRITKNLKTLVNDISKIEQGDLDARSNITGDDESTIIAAHLNKMVDKVNLILSSTSDAIWEYDPSTDKFVASAKYSEISGYKFTGEPKSINSILALIHNEDRKKTYSDFFLLLKGEIPLFQSEFRMKRSDSSYAWIYARGKIIEKKDNIITRVAGSMTDITEKKHYVEEIYKMAFYDSLTNLPNRRFFLKELAETIEHCTEKKKKAAIILIDLDDFKKITSTLGHGLGDKLLQELSLRLLPFKNNNIFPCNLGGDEFLILFKDINNTEEILIFCDKLREAINLPINLEGNHITVTASAGISIFPNDGSDGDFLIRSASIALQSAKNSGKNRTVLFHQSLYNKYNRDIELENCLKTADFDKEFNLYYQPQIDIKHNIIRGFEALIRWNSPILGSVSPVDFIPVAEQSTLIIHIGEWTIKKAFEDVIKLKSKGLKFKKVSINLSTLQLLEDTFLDFIDNIIEVTGIDTNLIEFEITESTLIRNVDHSIRVLNKLREKGFQLALDDFGTGYSSLSYIRMLPVEVLKIDKSFIANLESKESNLALIKGIVLLSHDLNMEVVAEGVEDINQLNILKGIECDIIQGYYFSKPLPYEDIENFYNKPI